MKVAIGCDHAGFPLKDLVIKTVRDMGHEAINFGTDSADSVDYPDYAAKVAKAVETKQADRGIVLCGSGIGASIAANKFKGIRAAIAHDLYSAAQGVEHDDMNVLCLGSRVVDAKLAPQLVEAFLNAKFSNEERHLRRLNKVLAIEAENFK
ncbi:MAG: ribose 5-phosphate isomerase B [Elusimicrobiota bacterium]|jgi:ribose 5-phosphate isomerase B|nr:ribose 5-phosphate isomerase B [Elusimicrobiota bacterium]